MVYVVAHLIMTRFDERTCVRRPDQDHTATRPRAGADVQENQKQAIDPETLSWQRGKVVVQTHDA